MNKLESENIKIRVKEPVYLENISEVFEKIDLKWSKCHRKPVKMYMLDGGKYCCASGILFIKATLSNYPFTDLTIIIVFFNHYQLCILNCRSLGEGIITYL